MDYEFKENRAADVVKVDMLINSEKVDALAIIVHRANAPTADARWRPRCAN
jgi:GTP-binding protein LepA